MMIDENEETFLAFRRTDERRMKFGGCAESGKSVFYECRILNINDERK